MTKAGNGGESLRASFVQSLLQTGHGERQPELPTSPPLGQVPTLRRDPYSWPSPPAPQEPAGGRGDIPFCPPNQHRPPDHTAPWTTLSSNHTARGKATQNEGEVPGWARC